MRTLTHGVYEVRSDNTTIKYYSFGGQTIMNDGNGLKYFLTDHLGSVVAVTNEDGELLSQQRYLPFGGIRSLDINDITQTDYGYTGQRNLDNEIGLMDYKARFYSPLLNKFIQPDSIVPHPFNSQSYNRYSYVYNNPIIYTDPSGHAICMEGTSSCYDHNTKRLLGNTSGSGCTSCWSTKEDDDEVPHCSSSMCNPNGSELPSQNTQQDSLDSNYCRGFDNTIKGCIAYHSLSLGLDIPTILMISGVALSYLGLPQYGVPIALSGLVFESCAVTLTLLCLVVKTSSLNATATLDEYGNLYVGGQGSLGKSVLPFVSVSYNYGIIQSDSLHIPTEAEVREHLEGLSFSIGAIGLNGVNYSPTSEKYKTSFYLVGFPEIISVNANYSWHVFDFSP